MAPRLGALLGSVTSTFQREELFAAWTTFFERVAGGVEPVVMLIDDAQYADAGLVKFVEHLMAAASFPCLVVLLTRPELLAANPSLVTNRRATVLHLEQLTDADMAALVDGLVEGLPEGVRDELVARAEGVPTFAVETVRALIDRDLVVPRGGSYVLRDPEHLDLSAIGAPASLQALISARLDTLSLAERRVVDRASVAGDSIEPSLLSEPVPRRRRPRRGAGTPGARPDPARRGQSALQRGRSLPVRPDRRAPGRLRHPVPARPQADPPRRRRRPWPEFRATSSHRCSPSTTSPPSRPCPTTPTCPS